MDGTGEAKKSFRETFSDLIIERSGSFFAGVISGGSLGIFTTNIKWLTDKLFDVYHIGWYNTYWHWFCLPIGICILFFFLIIELRRSAKSLGLLIGGMLMIAPIIAQDWNAHNIAEIVSFALFLLLLFAPIAICTIFGAEVLNGVKKLLLDR